MTGLVIRDVNKSYGAVPALRDVSLDVSHGQFVCLLGPSGCGKSTLLRILAGLESPSTGKIILDGADITGKPAHLRNFGMVFQSLALFPHLTVGENIAYPLMIRGVEKATRESEVRRLLDLVHLPGIETRAITQLSGGQRQRVAIARALSLKPKLFLLDEPMSALDAKLREAMQIELKRLQQELGITTILVTHDQREAMTTADLVVVMSSGVIQQVAAPVEIYRQPVNSFVADFIGLANLVEGHSRGDGTVEVYGVHFRTEQPIGTGSVTISVRPEDVEFVEGPGPNTLKGRISFVRNLGAAIEISVRVEGRLNDILVSLPTKFGCPLSVGSDAHVHLPPAACVVLR